jgi:hypothetical protein
MRSVRARIGLAVLVGLVASAAGAADAGMMVRPESGPWLLLVASYSGPKAEELASELAADIRNDYKMPAYLLNKNGEEKRQQEEKLRQLKELCPDGRFRRVRIEEQWAVLVGGYKDMDTAREALKKVKVLKPKSEKFMDRIVQVSDENKPEVSYRNPFQTAFVVRNPTVPHDNTPDPKLEAKRMKAIKEFNSRESYNLLKCHKPWTLVVKAYHGAVKVVGSDEKTETMFQKLFKAGDKTLLDAQSKQAHSLAEVLRKLGYEAYVLHLPDQSLVTVGGYERPDDPRLLQAQRTLGGMKLAPVEELMSQPLPMEVPRP